jgi:hypothetical protein
MTPNNSELLTAVRRIYVETAFITPADHNYVLARIAFRHGLVQQGYWEAAQAIEKYLKASLLLNGQPAFQGHNLEKLLNDHRNIWPKALAYDLPDSTPAPHPTVVDRGVPDTVIGVVARLAIYGNADNRYTRTGYVFDYLEVNKIDFVALLVRSTCRQFQEGNLLQNWRLSQHLPIETWVKDRSTALSNEFLNGNAVWSAAAVGHPEEVGRQPHIAFQASAIQSALMALNEEPAGPNTVHFLEWLVSNVKFSDADRQSLRGHIGRIENEIIDRGAQDKPSEAD